MKFKRLVYQLFYGSVAELYFGQLFDDANIFRPIDLKADSVAFGIMLGFLNQRFHAFGDPVFARCGNRFIAENERDPKTTFTWAQPNDGSLLAQQPE
jgi:hypothetical protein